MVIHLDVRVFVVVGRDRGAARGDLLHLRLESLSHNAAASGRRRTTTLRHSLTHTKNHDIGRAARAAAGRLRLGRPRRLQRRRFVLRLPHGGCARARRLYLEPEPERQGQPAGLAQGRANRRPAQLGPLRR